MPHISFSDLPDLIIDPPNTPRSVLACKKAGVEPSLLVYRKESSLSSNPEVAEFLFEEIEKDRQEMIADCMEEYENVVKGITQAEFELMGRPTALLALVPPKEEEILSSSKRQELVKRKQAEIAAASERFLRVEEFEQMKQEERENKNLEIEERILQRQREEMMNAKQLVIQEAERTAKAELEREQREQEHEAELERIKQISDQRIQELERRLREFRNEVEEGNQQKASERQEKMLKSKQYYEDLQREKMERTSAKNQLEEQRSIERSKELELSITETRERIQAREKRIKQNVNQKMDQLEKNSNEFGMKLSAKCKEHEINELNHVSTVEKKFEEKNSEKARKTEKLMEGFKTVAIEQLHNIQILDEQQRLKYQQYEDEILIEDRLKHEKYKLNEERGRIRAMRFQQEQEYQRKCKEAELKLRFRKVEEDLEAKEAEKEYVQYENSKFEAEKQRLEYEKYYGANGVKRSPSPVVTRSSLRPATTYSPASSVNRTKSQVRGEECFNYQQEIDLLIEKEELREKERKEELAGATTDEEKTALMRKFTAERAKNAEKIKKFNDQNRLEIGQ